MRTLTRLVTATLLAAPLGAWAQGPLYFPPTAPTDTSWARVTPAAFNWNQAALDSVVDWAGRRRSQALLILHDGRLAVEHYYGTYNRDSVHAWNSAGKTLTAALVGIARQEGRLTLDDSVSRFLGVGWTSASPAEEGRITVRHLLTMTSGLDPNYGGTGTPNLCSSPTCLRYAAPPGTVWAYHTGAYRRLEDVLTAAYGTTSYSNLTLNKIGFSTGLRGAWYNSVFYSSARSMARFGLLLQGRGAWAGVPVLTDTAYVAALRRPSQLLNPSYGLLTWLNGQPSFIAPGAPTSFNGPLIPAAPADLYAALGKDDQKIYVLPSRGLVVVRQGASAGASALGPSSFDNELWTRLMRVFGQPTRLAADQPGPTFDLFPSPATGALRVVAPPGATTLLLHDLAGRVVRRLPLSGPACTVAGLVPGVYVARLAAADGAPLASRRLVVAD